MTLFNSSNSDFDVYIGKKLEELYQEISDKDNNSTNFLTLNNTQCPNEVNNNIKTFPIFINGERQNDEYGKILFSFDNREENPLSRIAEEDEDDESIQKEKENNKPSVFFENSIYYNQGRFYQKSNIKLQEIIIDIDNGAEEKNNGLTSPLKLKNFTIENNIPQRVNHNNNQNNKPNKEKIFSIKKLKKTGRKKKNSSVEGGHNKFSNDNIKRKFKGKFISAILDYINQNIKSKNIRLKKIINKQKSAISIKKNKIWIKKTLREVFNVEITPKFLNLPRDHNIKMIEKIYRENKEIKVKKILEQKVEDFLDIYLGNRVKDKNEIFEIGNLQKFRKMEDDIKNEDEIFKEVYIKYAQKLRELLKK